MKRIVTILIAGAASLWFLTCLAYEPDTHQRLSDTAARNSALVKSLPSTQTTVLDDLGLKGYLDAHQKFDDSQAGEFVDLGPDGPTFHAKTPLVIRDLITTGAAIEDEGDRPFCHFYDPIPGHIHPLNFDTLSVNHVASYDDPDWATGVATGDCSMLGQGNEQQIYSLKNATDYFYKALTLSAKTDRDQNFGNLFLSLGHALHLLEDMAQPQHVRNDMHCDSWKCVPFGVYNPSRYEQYAYNHYTSYDPNYIPDFPLERDFWVTGDGQGLSEFTNRIFFSAGTLGTINGLNPVYPLPVLDGGSSEEPVAQVYSDIGTPMPPDIANVCNQPNSCQIKFYSTTGYDWYTSKPVVNPKASTDSVFNQDLTDYGDHPLYVLNDANYQEDEKLIFPEVIGYGAGLINHFFRGRLDVQPDPATPGNYLVINESQYQMNGTVEFYYDAVDGKRYPLQSTETKINLTAVGSSGGQVSIPVVPPTDPTPATSNTYMVVFNGLIGEEQGVVGKQIVSQPDLYVGDSYYAYGYTSNSVIKYDSDGNQLARYALLSGMANSPNYMAVYGQTIYAQSGYGQSGNSVLEYEPHLNSKVIVSNTIGSQSGYMITSGLAVNSKYLFVPGVDYNSANGTANNEIKVFDHVGNLQMTIPQAVSVESISANDQRMCVVERDQATELLDMTGGLVANLAAMPDNPYFNNAVCASSPNRHYVLIQYMDSSYVMHDAVYVYDDSGAQITAFDIDGALSDGGAIQMAATNSKLYISFVQSSQYRAGVAVFNRVTKDASGNPISPEEYQRVSDIGDGILSDGLAVDMASVLH